MTIHIIVAMTKDRVIGKGGALPWRIPEDTKLFKSKTLGNVVIMGKNTWLSLPQDSRPMPDRVNIVVSRSLHDLEGAIVCRSVPQAVEEAGRYGKEIFCIGGAQIYAEMLPLADVLHISWVKQSYAGDTLFPEVNFDDWAEAETQDFAEFTYKRYVRK